MDDDNAAKAPSLQADDAPPQVQSGPSEKDPLPDSSASAPAEAAKTSIPAENNNLQHSADPASAENKQPNSGSLSSSGVNSIKEEDLAASGPYGTRSRNRSARPNYADESDADFEKSLRLEPVRQSKHSTPSDSNPRLRASTELSSTAPNAASPSPAMNGSDRQSETANAGAGADAAEPSGPPPERKKRKYVWKNGSKPVPAARAAAANNHSVPVNGEDIPDSAHPNKKRRVTDGSSSTGKPSTTVAVTRKHSIARPGGRDSHIYTFRKTGALLKDGKLKADDGTVFAVDDHVYLVCEPPGDPYYLCRIMEFRRDNMEDPESPVTSMIVNWFYRPKDIGKMSSDSRFLYASMQSDESPINSLRGKCQITHRSQIKSLDEYRKQRDTFWFAQLYDRYIHRPYDLIPAASVINVPENVKKAINDRWKFLAVEAPRMKELTSAVKLCKRCNGYCAPNDSVDCGVCRNTYHMTCVRPPLAKKPSRGFAWSCGPCSRAQEKKLEQRHTAMLPNPGQDREDEIMEDEEEEQGAIHPEPSTVAPSVTSGEANELVPETQAEVAKAQQWPWRYLGIHCKVEDVLQFDDRAIYPRASSRLGPRHQAATTPWPGRPVELVKPLEVKKKFMKGAASKKDPKLSKDTAAALETEKIERAKRPKWVQDEPPGYVARGEDLDSSDPNCTAERLFVVRPTDSTTTQSFAAANAKSTSDESIVDEYMIKARQLARDSGVARGVYAASHIAPSPSRDIVPTNYLDKALNLLHKNNFDVASSLSQLKSNFQSPKEFGNPVFTKEETKRFEDGVARYGSELRLVRRHVKHRPYGDIVRFYYAWKKTERGREIWGRHDARRGTRKRAATSWTEIADDEDDSAFDNDKSITKKRKFQCKFCHVKTSPLWRRAPDIAPGAVVLADPKGSAKDKANQLVLALCQRCAIPWRRYSLRYEDPEELAKILQAQGGKTWKRRTDEEMLREMVLANEVARVYTGPQAAAAALTIGILVTVPPPDQSKKKKGQENELTPVPSIEPQPKKKAPVVAPPRPPTPPIVPQQPQLREFPCAICSRDDSVGPLITCTHCRLAVHRTCFAIPEHVSPTNWVCDTCVNDKSGLISFNYNCILCTVTDRQPEMAEQPKPSNHKKKTDRDREKERLEKGLADAMVANYKRDQIAKGRPQYPREAVKRTASNNWMHVMCAIWTPEIRFGDATRMECSEGMPTIMANQSRMEMVCKICQVVKGACISCHQCHATFHVACAREAGYVFGFDVNPIKGSRKDSISTVALGAESGAMTAAVWCKEHEPKTIVHGIHEIVEETGLTALQTFVRTYKQADLTVIGTARKANMLSQSTKSAGPPMTSALAGRRASILTNGASSSKRARSPHSPTQEVPKPLTNGVHALDETAEKRRCGTCGVKWSFRWWNSPGMRAEWKSSTYETVWQCHKCHVSAQHGEKRVYVTEEEEEEEERKEEEEEAAAAAAAATAPKPAQQRDFFELTMPAPLPPPTAAPPAPVAVLAKPLAPPSAQPIFAAPTTGAVVPEMKPGVAPLSQSGRNDSAHDSAQDILKWTQELWASTVIVTHFTGQSFRLSGREFGNLNDSPSVAWNHIIGRSQNEIGFNPAMHVLVTEDGRYIDNQEDLMTVVAKMLHEKIVETRWYVRQRRQPLQPPAPPPPTRGHFWPGVGGYHQGVPIYPHPAPSMQRAPSNPPPVVAGPIHYAGPPAHPPPPPHPGYPPQASPHMSPPYYSHSKTPSLGSNAGQPIPASISAGAASPSAVSIRPRTPAAGHGTPASSSPNVRNLVH